MLLLAWKIESSVKYHKGSMIESLDEIYPYAALTGNEGLENEEVFLNVLLYIDYTGSKWSLYIFVTG